MTQPEKGSIIHKPFPQNLPLLSHTSNGVLFKLLWINSTNIWPVVFFVSHRHSSPWWISTQLYKTKMVQSTCWARHYSSLVRPLLKGIPRDKKDYNRYIQDQVALITHANMNYRTDITRKLESIITQCTFKYCSKDILCSSWKNKGYHN